MYTRSIANSKSSDALGSLSLILAILCCPKSLNAKATVGDSYFWNISDSHDAWACCVRMHFLRWRNEERTLYLSHIGPVVGERVGELTSSLGSPHNKLVEIQKKRMFIKLDYSMWRGCPSKQATCPIPLVARKIAESGCGCQPWTGSLGTHGSERLLPWN